MSFKIIQPKSPFKQRSVSPIQKKGNTKIAQFDNSFNDDTFDNPNFKMSRIIENERYSHLIQPEPLTNIKEIARDILDLAQNHQEDTYDMTVNKNFSQQFNKRSIHLNSQQQKIQKSIDPLETVHRLLNAEHKKKEKILNKQLNVYMDELAEMQNGLKVNPKSEHILRNKNYQPIHLRTDEVIQQKQEKIYKLFQQCQEEKEMKDPMPSFTPNLEKQNQHQKRTFQEFISHMDNWIEKKNRNKQITTYQVVTQQMENTTFKPQINKKSVQILKEKNKNQENIDLAARMEIKSKEYEQKKKHLEQQIKEQYSYTPVINQKSKRLASRSQNRKNYKDGTAISNSKSPPRQRDMVIEMPNMKRDVSPRTLVKSKSSVSVRMSTSQVKSNRKESEHSNKFTLPQENTSNQRQLSNEQQKINQSYSHDFRVDEIANNREEILKKLSDYDKFKQYADTRLSAHQTRRHEDEQNQQQIIKERNVIQNNTANFNKMQYLDTMQNYNLQKQYQNELEQNYGQNNYQRSSSPFKYNNPSNTNNNTQQQSYFHARKKSHSRSISPNQNQSSNISRYNNKMTQSPQKNPTRSLQQQENSKSQSNLIPSSKDSVNQVLYHPNLDFIIGILSKKEKTKK